MTKVTVGSVFSDLDFTEDEEAVLKLKAQIFNEVIGTIQKKNLSRKELESILNVPQPRVSELMNGKISKVSIEKLIRYLQSLGKVPTQIKFKKVSGL